MLWVIDRIEDGGIAVLENPDTQETREVQRKTLPKGAKEGTVLSDTGADGGLMIDYAETAERKARIQERFNRLKKG